MTSPTHHKFIFDSDFNETISQHNNLILVAFFHDSSGISYLMESDLKMVSKLYLNKVSIYKMDIEKNNESVATYAIQKIPTILFFQNGLLIDRIAGAFSTEELKDRIQSYLSELTD